MSDQPQWIVNDMGELGVRIGERFFFLYKAGNIEYEDGKHEDGTPILWRIVGKREFGETCQPMEHIRNKWPGGQGAKYLEPLVYTPGLSEGSPDDGKWRQLPTATQHPTQGPDMKKNYRCSYSELPVSECDHCKLAAARARIVELTKERDRDLADMRKFQGKFMVADHALREATARIAELTQERDLKEVRLYETRQERDAARAEVAKLREALEEIAKVPEAYPDSVFREPDWGKLASTLAAAGFSIDAISGSNMRWRSEATAKIARAALAAGNDAVSP